MSTNDSDRQKARTEHSAGVFGWKAKAGAFAITTVAAFIVLSASDSVRPPYVGWKTELAGGAFVATVLAALAWWSGRTGPERREA